MCQLDASNSHTEPHELRLLCGRGGEEGVRRLVPARCGDVGWATVTQSPMRSAFHALCLENAPNVHSNNVANGLVPGVEGALGAHKGQGNHSTKSSACHDVVAAKTFSSTNNILRTLPYQQHVVGHVRAGLRRLLLNQIHLDRLLHVLLGQTLGTRATGTGCR